MTNVTDSTEEKNVGQKNTPDMRYHMGEISTDAVTVGRYLSNFFIKYQNVHVPNLFSMVVRFQNRFCFLSSPIISGEGKHFRLQKCFNGKWSNNKKNL